MEEWIKKYGWIGLICCLLVTGGFAVKLFQESKRHPSFLSVDLMSQTTELSLEETTYSHQDQTSSQSLLYVEVKGQVKYPGVYQMDEGQRVVDVIELAGGITQEADLLAVNQAQKIQDQMVIYVPSQEDTHASGEITKNQNQVGIGTAFLPDDQHSSDDKININLADQTALESLPGIGPKKAQAIIDYRTENGSFQTIEDLQQVPGIGSKTFESLADRIKVDSQ